MEEIMNRTAEIPELFQRWNQALQTGDPGEVVKQYAFNAVLLPTVSNKVRRSHEEIKDYFVHFLQKKPRGTINESSIRVYGDTAINSGIYTFEFAPPGAAPFTVQARYTFVYQWLGDRWLIVEHHSSQMPEKIA
jgi:uncharacterized protein (TIGR02246 family)